MKNQEKMQDLPRQISMFLDNELSQDDQANFLNTVKDNSQFNNMLDNERSFRNFVKQNVPRSHVSPALIKNIKDKIRFA